MSLEQKIEALTAAMERNSDLLEKIVTGAGAAKGETKATGRGKAKSKTEEDSGDADAGGDDDAVNPTKLKKTLDIAKGWLKEFAENDEDPENDARSEKLSAALEKLGIEKISTIGTEEHRSRVEAWVKKQIDIGRITPDPKAKGNKGADDDI